MHNVDCDLVRVVLGLFAESICYPAPREACLRAARRRTKQFDRLIGRGQPWNRPIMRATLNRRTATKVKDGRVQRKNRHRPTAHEGFVLDRESPGRGFNHVVTKRDVQAFLDIIPDWHRFSKRLERIVLARHGQGADGIYEFYHRE